jgi:RNase adapter protein RapZ
MSELVVMSFAISRGEPPDANLVFDMRFLRNPHWQEHLRPLSGLDAPVGAYIAGDPAYDEALSRIEALLLSFLPLYQADGKAFVRVAFGCTGGRHRSVHVAETVAGRLRAAGFSPRLDHRDLAAPPRDGTERSAGGGPQGSGAAGYQGD